MNWGLKIGPQLEALEKVEARTGKTPAMLLDQPEIYPFLSTYWEAYLTLDKSRQIGFNGPQPISLSEILAYCQLHDIEGPERDRLIHYTQVLDRAYHAWVEEEGEKARGRTSGRNYKR